MRVFVAGGTGAIGRHAVRALVGEGHAVTALARTQEKAQALTELGAHALSVSIFDRSALASAFEGHDAVVNLTSAIPPMTQFMARKAWAENDRVRTEGSAAIVDAAISAGVERVVQESVSMLYPDRGAEWIDEDVPPDVFPMARPNLAGRQMRTGSPKGAEQASYCGSGGSMARAPGIASSFWRWPGGTSVS